MPLMIYGADVPIEEDIDINSFVDIIDDESWKEFMPTGVSKKIFTEFTKYYDRDVFIAAGKRIRRLGGSRRQGNTDKTCYSNSGDIPSFQESRQRNCSYSVESCEYAYV